MSTGTAGQDPEQIDAFAHTWARALAGTTYVPMVWTTMVQFLAGLAGQLAAAVTAEPFDAQVGYRVGGELVEHDFFAAEALGRTLQTVHLELLAHLGIADRGEPRRRVVALAERLATAHSRAVRDLALDGQENVRRAALTAVARAERDLREARAKLHHAALHDALTGLPNRIAFTDRLRELLARPGGPGGHGRVAVCIVGLDAFDRINDSLGPEVGDKLLRAVAGQLHWFCLEAGYFLGRLDGDSFALLAQTTTGREDAIKIADSVLRLLEAPFYVDGHELPVQPRAGIVERAVVGDRSAAPVQPTELMRAAGLSLRWAKADSGPGWAVFDEDRNQVHAGIHRVSAAMPAALQRDEFTLYYQPLVDLTTGVQIGVEALARWEHPQWGLTGPDSFIKLAEDTGLIVPLGLMLLEKACRWAVRWRGTAAAGPYVSVNLAARQIQHVGLVGDIVETLDRTGLPPEALQLEITEGTAFDAEGPILTTLTALANLGIRLAIDDFGTGYANHAILPALPIHTLKLANTFVQGLDPARPSRSFPARPPGAGPDPKNLAVLKGLIDLGHNLGLTVTAEGVETADQAERLREMTCDTGQGWLFGRPVPGAQFLP